VRGRFPVLKGDAHNDVNKFAYGFIGYVVSTMCRRHTRAEGAAAVQMAREAVVFDAADRDRIRQSLLAYERPTPPWPGLPEAAKTSAKRPGAYSTVLTSTVFPLWYGCNLQAFASLLVVDPQLMLCRLGCLG
jgi:hypothetical protein